jgi:isopenicillin N synthase-like dioxygenase
MKDRFKALKEIDISSFFEESDPGWTEMDVLIANTLETDGAFVATGFPDSDRLEQAMTDLMRFFDLPLKTKMGCAVKSYQPGNPNTYRGYYPLPEETGWTHFAKGKEYFDIGPEPPMEPRHIPGGASFCEPNVWPEEEDLPNWQPAILIQLQVLRDIACVLMLAIARGLNLDSKLFADASYGRNASIRLLRQPDLKEIIQTNTPEMCETREISLPSDLETLSDGRRIVTGAHVDQNLLSVLWQSSAGGLQMQGRDETWKEVYPKPGTLSIHCGTLLSYLTAGKLTGTPHRVASNGKHKNAMGFFLEPDFDATVYTLDNGLPVTYAQHLVNLFPDRFTDSKAA